MKNIFRHIKNNTKKGFRFRDTLKYKRFTKTLNKESSKRKSLGRSYKEKILAFYDPRLHYGISSEDFVDALIIHFNETGDKILAQWIYVHKDSQCQYVSKLVSLGK